MILAHIFESNDPRMTAERLKLTQDDYKIGCVNINVFNEVTPEESAEFEQLGLDLRQISPVPIVYGYELEFGPSTDADGNKISRTTPEMDALKMRAGYTADDVTDHIISGMKYFLSQIMQKDPQQSSHTRRQGAVLAGITKLQNIIKDTSNEKTIIIVPSSSPLPQLLADQLSVFFNNRGVKFSVLSGDTFSKQDPVLSRQHLQIRGKDPDKARDFRKDRARLEELEIFIQAEDDPKERAKYQREYDNLKVRVDQGYKAKNMMMNSASDNGKAYYNVMAVKRDHQVATDVIIIDDNVVSGGTVAGMAKTLCKYHKKIINVCGFALHALVSPPKPARSNSAPTAKNDIATPKRTRAASVTKAWKTAREALGAGQFNDAEVRAWVGERGSPGYHQRIDLLSKLSPTDFSQHTGIKWNRFHESAWLVTLAELLFG